MLTISFKALSDVNDFTINMVDHWMDFSMLCQTTDNLVELRIQKCKWMNGGGTNISLPLLDLPADNTFSAVGLVYLLLLVHCSASICIRFPSSKDQQERKSFETSSQSSR